MQSRLNGIENIVVVGAGFIGVELADELNKTGKHVTLVEKLPHILGLAFDEEFAEVAEEQLKKRGVEVITGTGIQSISGNGRQMLFSGNGKYCCRCCNTIYGIQA